jgi:hypothetical protein
MILLQRFGEILVHLGLNTFLAIAKHSMSSESYDRSSLGSKAPFIFTDLSRGLESTLSVCQNLINRVDMRSCLP